MGFFICLVYCQIFELCHTFERFITFTSEYRQSNLLETVPFLFDLNQEHVMLTNCIANFCSLHWQEAELAERNGEQEKFLPLPIITLTHMYYFNNTFKILYCVASKGRLSSQWWTAKNVKGICRGLIWVNLPLCVKKDYGINRIINFGSNRMAKSDCLPLKLLLCWLNHFNSCSRSFFPLLVDAVSTHIAQHSQ